MSISRNMTIQGIIVVMSATIIHLTFGYFYTLGNMVPYITSTMMRRIPDFKIGSTVWLSAASLCTQGIAMPIGGLLTSIIGFRLVVIIGCILNSGGTLLTYFSVQHSYVYVLVTYSILTGFGLGFAYAVVLTIAGTWFPGRPALVFGIVAAGFGFGGIIFTQIQKAIINPHNVHFNISANCFTENDVIDRVQPAFLILGSTILAVQIVCCIFLRPCPEKLQTEIKCNKNDEPENKLITTADSTVNNFTTNTNRIRKEVNLTLIEVLKRHEFYLLWLVMLCNIIPITLITAIYKVYGAKYIDNDYFLSNIATASAFLNSTGRIIWGAICDKCSFKLPIIVMLCLWGIILATFPHIFYWEAAQYPLYAIWICLLFLTLSGVFAMMPAAVSRIFGSKHLAVNYGFIFSSFSFGSVICACLSELIEGQWYILFTICGGTCYLAAFIMLWIHDMNLPKNCRLLQICSNVCQRVQPMQTIKMETLNIVQ